MSVPRRVAGLLDLAEADVEAADLLAAKGNRYAAYHLQQAVEKLMKALLLAAGQEGGVEHRLDVLFARLSEEGPWKGRLRGFVGYTQYATTFRYPTPGGRIPAAPDPVELAKDLAVLRPLLEDLRRALAQT
jgi:HEPN domain-containing protein